MSTLRIQFLGSGDAFGSGGRFNTCILVVSAEITALIDCGASSLIAMRRFGVKPADIDLVLLSHLHGDHFAGVPFLVLDAQLVSKRTRPLIVAGPPGTKQRLNEAMEILFPGSSTALRQFTLDVRELEPRRANTFGAITVTPYVVCHPSGVPPLALRVDCAGKIVTYSGDTEWTETLVEAARDADLFIAEAYFFDKKVRYHLDFATLMAHVDEIKPKRLIATHMSADMLGRIACLPQEFAGDGLVIEL